MKTAKTVKQYKQLKQILIPIRSFKDAEVLISKCDESILAIEAQNEEIYQKASAMVASGDYCNAIIAYGSIPEYKDTFERIKECAESSRINRQQQLENIDKLKGKQKETQNELNTLNDRLDALENKKIQMTYCRDSLKKSREEQRTLMKQRDVLAAEFSGLSVFAFSRKKQIQADINYCDSQLA